MAHQSLHLQTGTAVVFQIVIGFLLLIPTCTGQSEVKDLPQPITAMAGDDITLPCLLKPPKDATLMTVEWGKLDLRNRFMHVWHEGQEHGQGNERASVSASKLKHGDASLKLSDVRLSDRGRYRCYIPKERKEDYVELLVGLVSSPEVRLAGLAEGSSGVMLDCRSGAWSPEPELFWLDAEGHVLSAGPTETTRGSDGLHAVSSRVTVQKSPNNTITCRIHQKDLQQSRETHVHVPDDFFVVRCSRSVSISFSVIFCCLFLVSASSLVFWRQRNISKKKETTKTNKEQKQLMRAELEESNKSQEPLDDVIKTLISEDLRELEKKFTTQMNEAQNVADDFNRMITKFHEEETKLKPNDKESRTKKKLNQNENETMKALLDVKLREIMNEVNAKLNERKKGYQEVQLDIHKKIREINEKINQADGKNKKENIKQEEMKNE